MHKLHDPLVKRMKVQSYFKSPHLFVSHFSTWLENFKPLRHWRIYGYSSKSELLVGKFQESSRYSFSSHVSTVGASTALRAAIKALSVSSIFIAKVSPKDPSQIQWFPTSVYHIQYVTTSIEDLLGIWQVGSTSLFSMNLPNLTLGQETITLTFKQEIWRNAWKHVLKCRNCMKPLMRDGGSVRKGRRLKASESLLTTNAGK